MESIIFQSFTLAQIAGQKPVEVGEPWIPTDEELDLGHEDCSVCEELRVVGPDHRNTLGAEHDEGCSRSC